MTKQKKVDLSNIEVLSRQVVVRLGIDERTREPLMILNIGAFTEIGMTLDVAGALQASLSRVRELYIEKCRREATEKRDGKLH